MQCPFLFASMPKGAFTGFQMIFSFCCLSSRKRNVVAECGSLPHEWNRQPHTAGKPGKKNISVRLNKFRQIGNIHTSLYVVCLVHASGIVFFLLVVPSFYGFLFEVFLPICLCFRLPPFCAFQCNRINHFRSGCKGNSGIGRESKVKPPVFCGNLQPFG